MNIDGANILSVLPVQTLTKGTVSSLTTSDLQAGFTQAFLEQLTKLGAETIQSSDLLKSIQTNTNASDSNKLQSLVDLLGNRGDMQKLAAFFGNELPATYKTDDNVDLEAALSALADSLKIANNSQSASISSAQQTLEAADYANSSVIQMGNQSEAAPILMNVEEPTTQSTHELSASDSENIVTTDTQINLKNYHDNTEHAHSNDVVAAALLNSLLTTGSSVEQNHVSNSVDSSINNQQALATGLKNASQNTSVMSSAGQNDDASKGLLQKPTGESPSEQSKPGFNLNYFEKAEISDDNGQQNQESQPGGDKILPRGIAEMGQLNRQSVELRSEVSVLSKPITHPGWSNDLGERILWMANKAIPSADIKLNPPNLGPISVRVDISQDQATVSFAAQQNSVREALEASIPKLREMLVSQQLNLVDVNVSQHFSSDQGRSQAQNFAQTTAKSGSEASDLPMDAIDEPENGLAVISKGLLSIYA
ncbi:MAG: hypothetical protein HOP23_17680 [Methylococcaceae bacterium]|nr:hypothetical protein [Methylococcaceae bacterium]